MKCGVGEMFRPAAWLRLVSRSGAKTKSLPSLRGFRFVVGPPGLEPGTKGL